MPSLLSRLGNLAIPAAAARGSYVAGKTEGTRQTMLDKMQAALQQSQVDENKQRSEYYKGLSTDNWYENANGDIYNRRTGVVNRGPGKQTPHGEEHYDPERGEVGFTTMGTDGTVGWKKTRDATRIDKMKYERIPRDTDTPPPEQPGVVAARDADQKRKKADDLVSSFLATHDLDDLTAENLQVFAGHILTAEERSALGRTRTPPAAERAMSVPPIVKPTITPRAGPKTGPAPRKKPGEDPVVSVEFSPVGGKKTNPQDEVDKAALRTAHPEMTEAQITELLAKLRTKPPEE